MNIAPDRLTRSGIKLIPLLCSVFLVYSPPTTHAELMVYIWDAGGGETSLSYSGSLLIPNTATGSGVGGTDPQLHPFNGYFFNGPSGVGFASYGLSASDGSFGSGAYFSDPTPTEQSGDLFGMLGSGGTAIYVPATVPMNSTYSPTGSFTMTYDFSLLSPGTYEYETAPNNLAQTDTITVFVGSTPPVPVPEPTGAVGILGLILASFLRRKRRSRIS